MTLRWPDRVLKPAGITGPFLEPRSLSGPPSIDGTSGYERSSLGRWAITLNDVTLTRTQQIKCFRAIGGMLNGQTTPILVPVYDKKQSPFPIVNGRAMRSWGSIPFSDGAKFSDGSGFRQPVIAATAAAANVRATSLDITMVYGADLEGSEFFSIDDWLYQVLTVDDVDRSGASPVYSVTIQPELRVAIAADTVCEFDDPVCRCVLATAEEMSLALTDRGFRGKKSVSFIEDDVPL